MDHSAVPLVRGGQKLLLLECFTRLPLVQRLAWPFGHQIGDRAQVILALHRQVRALGQELVQQLIDVIVQIPLSGTEQIAEVPLLNVGGSSKVFVRRHLLVVEVVGCLTQRRGDQIEFGRKGRQRRRGRSIWHLVQRCLPRCAVDQHVHGRLIARARDQIGLPVARHQPIAYHRQAHVDGNYLSDLPPTISAGRTRPADALALAQRGNQLPARLTSGINARGVVYRLSQHLPVWLFWADGFGYGGNLLRRPPAPAEQTPQHATRPAAGMQLGHVADIDSPLLRELALEGGHSFRPSGCEPARSGPDGVGAASELREGEVRAVFFGETSPA